jgi:hypothetical protein
MLSLDWPFIQPLLALGVDLITHNIFPIKAMSLLQKCIIEKYSDIESIMEKKSRHFKWLQLDRVRVLVVGKLTHQVGEVS